MGKVPGIWLVFRGGGGGNALNNAISSISTKTRLKLDIILLLKKTIHSLYHKVQTVKGLKYGTVP